MSRRAGYAIYAAAVLAAIVAALFSRARVPPSELPSVDNAGPRGLKALRVYLEETGQEVVAHRSAFESFPAEVATIVIAAPEARPIGPAEVDALERFVERGGTLVYLAPPDRDSQPHLGERFPTSEGKFLAAKALLGRDASGASAQAWIPTGVLAGVNALRVAAGGTSTVRDQRFVPIAGNGPDAVLWSVTRGKGTVLVASGPSIAANQRLHLEDNLQLWANLAARGPMLFDEYHHVPAPPPPASRGMHAVALQFAICALVFLWARGTRLGPPRPERVERHRSTLEYLAAFAWLTRRSRVEPQLLRESLTRLRRLMHDREGIAVTLPHADAALRLHETCNVPPERYLRAVRDAENATAERSVDPRRFRALSAALMELEDAVAGRR